MRSRDGKRFFALVPVDERTMNWVFYVQVGDEPLRLRDRYKPFQCNSCRKIDEQRALNSGFDSEVRIRSRYDFVGTRDNLICVSSRLRDVLTMERIGGLAYYDFPGDKNYTVVQPTVIVETDGGKAGVRFEGPVCQQCGRYKGVYGGQWVGAMTTPENEMTIFTSAIWNENERTRVTWLLASEQIVKKLRAAKVRGIDFIES